MKKWILVSTIIHLLVLKIPFEKKEKIQVNQKSTEIKMVKIDIKEIKNQGGVIKNSHFFHKKKLENQTNKISEKKTRINKINKINEDIEKIDEIEIAEKIKFEEIEKKIPLENFSKENEEKVITSSEKPIEKEFEAQEIKTYENIEKENSQVYKEKEQGLFIKNDNSEVASFDKKEFDENLLTQGEVSLIKENGELQYKILESPVPNYPSKAKILNLTENIFIIAQFTVDLNGKVKDIILDSDFSKFKKYDFDVVIEKALKKYRFTPIIYKNKVVEVRFKKIFEFNSNK